MIDSSLRDITNHIFYLFPWLGFKKKMLRRRKKARKSAIIVGWDIEMTAIDMIYHKEYTIHTYETDARGLAKTVTLLNYLQDAAGDHAGRLGWSVLDLFKRNMTWVLSRYHILVHRYPAMGERLEVTTWPSGKSGYFATRDFEVADGERRPGPLRDELVDDRRARAQAARQGRRRHRHALRRRQAGPRRSVRLPARSGLPRRRGPLPRRSGPHRLEPPRQQRGLCPVGARGGPPELLRRGRAVELEVSYRAEAFYGDEVVSDAQRLPDEPPGPRFLHQILNAATGTELARLRTRWE